MPVSHDPSRADLTSLVRATWLEEAVAGRTRERHLRLAATTVATIAGALRDAADRRQSATIRTRAGALVHGPVAVVARDAVMVDHPSIGPTLIPFGSVAMVVFDGAGGDVTGDRRGPPSVSFAGLVGDLAASRAEVRVGVLGVPAPVSGQLRSASNEVLVVRMNDPAATAVVAFAQVSELTVLASG